MTGVGNERVDDKQLTKRGVQGMGEGQGLESDLVVMQPCGLGQVAYHLGASVSLPVKWE